MPPILILDDDGAIRDTLALYFRDEGYSVVTFEQGRDALEYLRHHPFPHIVLTDFSMPTMMGDEFLRRLREDWPRIPHCAIIMAARTRTMMPSAVSDMLNRWNIPYLKKPFDIPELQKAIDACHM